MILDVFNVIDIDWFVFYYVFAQADGQNGAEVFQVTEPANEHPTTAPRCFT